jgi:ppGpp synthetase/RelA/SpoT-type nucleotidyltranferase
MPKKHHARLNQNENESKYDQIQSKYQQLAINLSNALKLILEENKVHYLSIDYRTKAKDSFLEKIERKKYDNPFDQIEDLCGIRIICYHHKDIDIISQIINKELTVLENQDKENLLADDQFGYRSTHFIIKINDAWLQAPNYRGLEGLKAEIQVRTVLMHAWAEIEHKLAYKKESHIPKQFKRKLSRISAKLEEADEQFEELKESIKSYQHEVTASALEDYNNIELNLDSLQAYLDLKFPNKLKNISETTRLLDDLIKYNISLEEVNTLYDSSKKYLLQLEKEMFSDEALDLNKDGWAQVGVIRFLLHLTHDYYYNSRSNNPFSELIDKYRKILTKK